MEKLIVTCCVFDENRSHFDPKAIVNMPKTNKEVADSVREAMNAGAAVVHVHQPMLPPNVYNEEAYLDFAQRILPLDIIFEHRGPGPLQCGFAMRNGQDPVKYLAEQRAMREKIDLGVNKPEMVVIFVGPQHMDWGKTQHYVMPTIEELEEHMVYLNKCKVKPSFEVWGANSLHNLRRLIEKKVLDAPYWLELCMGVTGSTSPPANPEEVEYIVKRLPKGSMWYTLGHIPPKGDLSPQELIVFYAQTISMGGHVRVGMEDCPYFWDGTPAKGNGQLVESVVRIARDMGREIATPAEARQMLGLPKRKK